MRFLYVAVAVLLASKTNGFMHSRFSRFPKRTMLPLGAATASQTGLSNEAINLFGKGEAGKGADSKWLLGGKG